LDIEQPPGCSILALDLAELGTKACDRSFMPLQLAQSFAERLELTMPHGKLISL
jgi:hypothetical protein